MNAASWSMRVRLAVLGTSTWVTTAAAEPSHRELGAAHYAKGNYAAAAAEFRLCIATEQQADCSFALAQALRVLGDCPGAVRSYKDFLATQPAPAEERAAREAITACGGTYEPPPPAPPPPAPAPVVPAEPPPSKREPGHRNLAVAALVVGGVATAVGATSVWLASAAHDDATQLGSGNGTLDEFEARLDDAHRYRWIGGAALGLGGALLITATLTLVLRDDTATPTTASVIASGDGVVVTARLPF